MINKISTIIDRALNNKLDRPLNILTLPTHEGFQTMLSETGHNFYMISGEGMKTWNFKLRPLPPNHYIYENSINKYRPTEVIDLILCQNRAQQFPLLQHLATSLNVPLIVLDHTEPPPGINQNQLLQLISMRGNVHVFITQHNKETWQGLPQDIVIRHGINTEIFQGWKGNIAKGVSLVNLFPQRDVFCGWNLWQEISKGVQVDLFGENPGLSQPINDEITLVSTLSQYRYYLNTSQWSPIPLSMLEAMSIGLPVVTTAKQEIPKYIQNGVNGFISNDPKELIAYCKLLENDYELAKKMGEAARETIIKHFNIERFRKEWNFLFRQVYNLARNS